MEHQYQNQCPEKSHNKLIRSWSLRRIPKMRTAQSPTRRLIRFGVLHVHIADTKEKTGCTSRGHNFARYKKTHRRQQKNKEKGPLRNAHNDHRLKYVKLREQRHDRALKVKKRSQRRTRSVSQRHQELKKCSSVNCVGHHELDREQ